MEGYTDNHISAILTDGSMDELKKVFPDVESFASFRSNTQNDNMLHMLVKFASIEFAEAVYGEYSSYDSKKVNELLLDKNNVGEIPARVNIDNISSLKPANIISALTHTKEKQRIARNIIAFKQKTKDILRSANKISIYENENEFKDGIPLKTILNGDENDGFSFKFAVYPDIKLVKYFYKKDKILPTDNINFIENFEDGKENRGELVDLKNLPMDGGKLSDLAKKTLYFPEDFSVNLEALDTLGDKIKKAYADKNKRPLYQNFIKNGGVFLIENKTKEFSRTNLIKNGDTVGSFRIVHDSENNKDIPLLALNAKHAKYKDHLSTTIDHEMTHAADNGFSSLKISDFFLAMDTSRTENVDIYKDIAEGYQTSSFNREALARLNSLADKDDLTKEYCKLFTNYVDAVNNSDARVIRVIIEADKSVSKAQKFEKYVRSFKENLQKKKPFNYADFYAPDLTRGHVTVSLLSDLKKLNYRIKSIKKEMSPSEKDDLQTLFKDDFDDFSIKSVFDETSKRIRGNNLKQLSRALNECLSDIELKGKEKESLFKVGIITTEIRKFLPNSVVKSNYNVAFTNYESANYIKENFAIDKDAKVKNNSDLLRHANKMAGYLNHKHNFNKVYNSGKINTEKGRKKTFSSQKSIER